MFSITYVRLSDNLEITFSNLSLSEYSDMPFIVNGWMVVC